MANRLAYLFLAIAIVSISCALPPYLESPRYLYDKISTPRNMEIKGALMDNRDRLWGIGISSFYGFREFWLTRLGPDSLWTPPIYTGFPVYPAYYRFSISNDTLSIKILDRHKTETASFYHRENSPPDSGEWRVTLQELTTDTDMDGLSDLAEEMLWTDPENNDSDFDGKADGFDSNPLGASVTQLTIHEKLHKHVIELELAEIAGDQLVLVEQIHDLPMEYRRQEGVVLSLSSSDLDEFVETIGYGPPILTASVKDTLRQYKVEFQYFIAPNDAWGYSVLYRWNKENKKWQEGKLLDSWEAE